MIILIDQIDHWEQISAPALKDSAEVRRYYLAKPPYFALLVCRNDLRLGNVLNLVVDAQVGWDRGDVGFARLPGTQQTKVTIYRVADGHPERRLSHILRDAPKE